MSSNHEYVIERGVIVYQITGINCRFCRVLRRVYPDQRTNHSRMPDEYLTIKEASAKTGKAEITIRRLVQRIVKGSNPALRTFIKPTSEELEQHHEGPPPAWRIDQRFLQEHFATLKKGSAQPESTLPPSPEDQVVTVLRAQVESLERQLLVKDEQIKKQTELVGSLGNQLNERLREGNFLMKGLQERMTLPAPTPSSIVENQPMKQSPKAETSRTVGERKPKKLVVKKQKSGWMNRLFGTGKSST